MSTITPRYGEALEIMRRRRGETQREAATRLGLSTYAYRRLEAATERPADAPREPRCTLTPGERLRLVRVRAGLPLKDCAEAIGMSRFWIIKIEADRESPEKLEEFWARHAAPTSV